MTGDELDPRWVGAFIPLRHWHFHRQLLARYGIVLLPGEFSAIVCAIRSGRSLPVERRRKGGVIHLVWLPTNRALVFVLALGSDPLSAWPAHRELVSKAREIAKIAAGAGGARQA